jgi:LysR family cyn operon transcriptional activator
MTINLEWYRVFYWTAKTGSLSRAAQHLYISQPAVSHTLKQLELALGGPLFLRNAKGVTLTMEGQTLFAYIEQAFSFMEAGERKIADMHSLHSGEMTIGANDTLCQYFLLPYLEEFHKAYPGVKIRVTNRTSPETVNLLKEGKIDFGIVHLPADDPRIQVTECARLQDCLVGGRGYAGSDAARNGLELTQLEEHPLLLLERGSSTRRFLDDYARAHALVLKPELELGSADLLIQFAKSGFGLAFAVRDYIEDELAAGELIEIRLTPPLPSRGIGLATLRGTPLSAAAKRFIALLPGGDQHPLG